MDKHKQDVSNYFDKIASKYSKRTFEGDKLHQYFFTQRLEKALEGMSLSEKSILDYGAGSGSLYSTLIRDNVDFSSYLACDISSAMLENSPIPSSDYIVGDAGDLPSNKCYDVIFMLGVTTYLTKKECDSVFHYFSQIMNDKGMLIVTFTNYDYISRASYELLSRYMRKQRLKNDNSIGSGIDRNYYSTEGAYDAIEQSGFEVISKPIFLNQTVFPLNKIFSSISVSVARKYLSNCPDAIQKKLSSDFMIKCVKAL